jgi:rhodanese-related sulfurtransferase
LFNEKVSARERNASTMKTAHDLVLAAKAQCTEAAVKDAPAAVLAADIVIDVREPDEYAAGHLAGAINIPRGLLEFKLSSTPALEKRDLNVVLYCKTSGRAALAAVAMQSMGYLNVVSVAGGFEAWEAAGLPIVKPATPVFE